MYKFLLVTSSSVEQNGSAVGAVPKKQLPWGRVSSHIYMEQVTRNVEAVRSGSSSGSYSLHPQSIRPL